MVTMNCVLRTLHRIVYFQVLSSLEDRFIYLQCFINRLMLDSEEIVLDHRTTAETRAKIWWRARQSSVTALFPRRVEAESKTAEVALLGVTARAYLTQNT
jgi:hypothetical protein